MGYAITVNETGGPEVLRVAEASPPKPGSGEVLIRHKAVGLNYIDTYHRTGLYPVPLPYTPGLEAAGVVEEAGPDVADLAPGQRVAYGAGPLGAYADRRIMPADKLVALPDAISDEQAAAMMLKGMTVEYLIRRTFKVEKGQTVLFHAAAGGVGLIACQWLKHLGARVIGTVGSEEKAALAKERGCDWPVRYDQEDFVERLREITEGAGVPVVYDSVGKDTFLKSMDCLQRRGTLVSFGQSSGPVEPFSPGLLSQKGSLYLTRPVLMDYAATKEELRACAAALFEVVALGAVKIEVNQRYPLKEAAQAHRDLEARKTTGSTVLLVEE